MIVALSKLALLVPPLMLGRIIDGITNSEQGNLASGWLWIVIFLLASLFQSVVTPVQAVLLNRFVQHTIRDCSITWIKDILAKDFDLFDGLRLGNLMKGVERGIAAHEKLLIFIVTILFPLCAQILAYIGLIISVGGLSIFFSIAIGCFAYAAATHLIIRWRRKHIDRVNDCEDTMIGEFATLFRAAKSVKLENAIDTAVGPISQAFMNYSKAAIVASWSGSLLNASQGLAVSAATCAVLAWGLIDQASAASTLSAGDIVSLFTVACSLFATIVQFGESYRFLDQFAADRRPFVQLLSAPSFMETARTEAAASGALVLSAGLISAPDAPAIILKSALEIQPGQKVAIVGESGSGKTTLLEALAGLRLDLRSRVTIGPHSLAVMSPYAHLATVRYCSQQPQFLSGGFEHAVLFGGRYDRVETILSALELELFRDRRVDYISEGATNISGGEAKRLSLLRILARPGAFNLIDEPTASLDPALVRPVWETIFSAVGEHALVVVTHDLSMIDRFDRILVMRKGEIIADEPPRRDHSAVVVTV